MKDIQPHILPSVRPPGCLFLPLVDTHRQHQSPISGPNEPIPPVPFPFDDSFPGIAAGTARLIHVRPLILARSLVELDLPLRRRPGW